MTGKRRLTAPEFEAIRPMLRMTEDRIEAARLALVEGQTLQGVANIFNWKSRQAVGDAVRIAWGAYEKYQEGKSAEANAGVLMPEGWERVELVAPRELIELFRAQIEEAREALPSGARGGAGKRSPAGARNGRKIRRAR
jgi:hypothetical protein